jgi:hypothetical protein
MMTIPDLHVGRGSVCGGVTTFPVWADIVQLGGIDTGPRARVEVREVADGADVEHLAVTNRGPKPVLLLEGELLEGGRQTRTLACDVLLAPAANVVVDVACVEQGRWDDFGGFARRGRKVSASVQHRLRADEHARQVNVWSLVARFEAVTGATPTGSFADHLDRAAARGVGDIAAPRVLPGQVGVIVGVAGWPVGLELFHSPAALTAHLPAILEAAQLDALLVGAAAPVPGRRARRFAAALSGREVDPTPARVGDGDLLAVDLPEVAARGIAARGSTLAHLSALNLRHVLVGAR